MRPDWLDVRIGERRIGQRSLSHEPRVGWRVPPKSARARKDPRRWPQSECSFVDLSVSGARILAPSSTQLRVGSRVLLDYEGEMTSARIRRVEYYNRTLSIYGVVFVELGGQLKEIIYAITGQHRGDIETRWDSTD